MFERFKGLFSESEDEIKIAALEYELATLRYELDNPKNELPPPPESPTAYAPLSSLEEKIKQKGIELTKQKEIVNRYARMDVSNLKAVGEYHLAVARLDKITMQMDNLKYEYSKEDEH